MLSRIAETFRRGETQRRLSFIGLGTVYAAYAYWIGTVSSPLPAPLCPLFNLTGIPCPLCGLTRSWGAFLHGRVADAFAYHPLGPFLVLAATLFLLNEALGLLRNFLRRPAQGRSPRRPSRGCESDQY